MIDLFEFLRGCWTVEREIVDRQNDRVSHFSGFARYLLSQDGLDYIEDGTHGFDGSLLSAQRRYLYTFPSRERAHVSFMDGQPFHKLVLGEEIWTDTHTCGSDYYKGTFHLLNATTWSAEWRVSGPDKDYTSSTAYGRVNSPACFWKAEHVSLSRVLDKPEIDRTKRFVALGTGVMFSSGVSLA